VDEQEGGGLHKGLLIIGEKEQFGFRLVGGFRQVPKNNIEGGK